MLRVVNQYFGSNALNGFLNNSFLKKGQINVFGDSQKKHTLRLEHTQRRVVIHKLPDGLVKLTHRGWPYKTFDLNSDFSPAFSAAMSLSAPKSTS